ncbi:response regulator [Singulisphaera sp. Ch08]|uniref:Response regulator n=1 Tax=Singulisphaera sp. Ch08 TaxID=3120278 RepID=A0AAU7CJX4_9BACT
MSRTVASALENLDPPPDWILLDLWLSDGDGEDVLRHVRAAGIPSHVAVISAGLDSERIASLQPLQPDLMIPKPISFEKLLEACKLTRSAGRDEPDSAGRPHLRRSD